MSRLWSEGELERGAIIKVWLMMKGNGDVGPGLPNISRTFNFVISKHIWAETSSIIGRLLSISELKSRFVYTIFQRDLFIGLHHRRRRRQDIIEISFQWKIFLKSVGFKIETFWKKISAKILFWKIWWGRKYFFRFIFDKNRRKKIGQKCKFFIFY